MVDAGDHERGTGPGRAWERAHRVADQVVVELVRRDPDGRRLAALLDHGRFDPGAAADVLLPTAEVWTEEIGPFLDVDGVRRILAKPDGTAISKQAVSKRRDLLALRTGSGRVVYPRFQFRGGGVLPGLGRLLSAVPEGALSRWTLASWLLTPQPTFGGDRPADLLAEGCVEPVLAEAEDWARALAG